MNKYIKQNYNYWNREYHSPNIESFIFRLKPYLLDKFLPKNKKLDVLDFGCGEGSNIKFFEQTYGYRAHGVDISTVSIKNAKKKYPKKNKFKIIKSEVSENEKYFNKKFDLILSIQTLYYLTDSELEKRLHSLNSMLKKNGLVFFTMMSTENNYFKKYSNKKIDKEGMTKVNLSKDKNYKKRQKLDSHVHFINFTKNKNCLTKKFKKFKPLAVGSYDMRLESLHKSEHHFTFLGGRKERK
jgi:cyclopropane fatty-acyl-phospholipid synthase-like methyltransferase